MICPTCHTELEADEKVCPSCQTVLSRADMRKRKKDKPEKKKKKNVAPVPAEEAIEAETAEEETSAAEAIEEATVQSTCEEVPAAPAEEAMAPVEAAEAEEAPAEEAVVLPEESEEVSATELSEDAPQADMPAEETEAAPAVETRAEARPKRRWWKRALAVFLSLLLIGGLLAGGYFLNDHITKTYGTWERMFKVVFGLSSLTEVSPATVTSVTVDGLPAHTITVYGESPDVLVVESMNDQKIAFEDGKATITVQDSYWIPKTPEPGQNNVTVALSLYVLDNRERRVDVSVPSYTVPIPEAPAAFEVKDVFTTYDKTYELKITLAAGSRVIINDEVVTESAEATEYVHSLPLEVGKNLFHVVVEADYTTPSSCAFEVERLLVPAEYTLPNYTSTITEETRTISVTVSPGASLRTDAENVTITAKNSAAGTYDITFACTDFKQYAATFHVEREDLAPVSFTIEFARVPDPLTFADSCTQPDLNKLFKSPEKYLGENYCFDGTVKSVTEDSFVLQLGEEQAVTFIYYGDASVQKDASVRVYGELTEIVDEILHGTAWFVVL